MTQTAFGEHAPDEDPDHDSHDFTFNLRYPGQYFDAESGLHYNYFGDYEPSTGRYIQSDPIRLKGRNATYSYADTNPLLMRDTLGLIAECDNCCSGVVFGSRSDITKCCNGKATICINPNICDKWDGPGEICVLMKECTKKHGRIHRDQHFDCSKQSEPIIDKSAAECAAWNSDIERMMRGRCGSAACRKQMKNFLMEMEHQKPGARKLRNGHYSGGI